MKRRSDSMQVSTFANAVWAPLLGPDTDVDNIEWGDGTHEPHGVAVDGEGNIIVADVKATASARSARTAT